MSEKVASGEKPKSLPDFESAHGESPNLAGMRAISILAVKMAHMGLAWIPGEHGIYFAFHRPDVIEKNHPIKFYKCHLFRLYAVITLYCLVVPLVFLIRDGWVNVVEPISARFSFPTV